MTATSATSSSTVMPPWPTGRPLTGPRTAGYGTAGYNGHPASLEDYLARSTTQPRGDHERFIGVKQPVYIREQCLRSAGRTPFEGEVDATRPR